MFIATWVIGNITSRLYFSRGENEIPRALFLVLKSLRVFGHVDFSVFVELMKDIQYVTLRPHEYLFKIGEPDEVSTINYKNESDHAFLWNRL